MLCVSGEEGESVRVTSLALREQADALPCVQMLWRCLCEIAMKDLKDKTACFLKFATVSQWVPAQR